jgi:tetratricopeptide (TPR) repeat protein
MTRDHGAARAFRVAIAAAMLLVGRVACAEDDPDTEVARREFQRGTELYEAHDYEAAITAFRQAERARPLPALRYNIARSYDRLGRWPEAIEAYTSYLERVSPGAAADVDAEVRRRIAELRTRLAEQQAAQRPSSSPPPPRRAWLAAGITVGALGLAGLAAALGTGLRAQASLRTLDGLKDDPDRRFDPADEEDLRQSRIATWSLLAVGGVALVVGGVVLGVGLRRDRTARPASMR